MAEVLESSGVALDEQTHDDFKNMITSSNGSVFLKVCLRILSSTSSGSMRWHPLMIWWCLYLWHRYTDCMIISMTHACNHACIHCNIIIRSSGAYEALRDSGCMKLPSQRTLRDCTHYVKASSGFSSEVDKMLIQVAKVDMCPEREKNIILRLDEMHIREDIVFDKYSGTMDWICEVGGYQRPSATI